MNELTQQVEEARKKARHEAFRAFFAKGADGQLGGMADAQKAHGEALDRLIRLERAEAVDEWCRDPKSCETAEARLQAAIKAIMGGEHE